MSNENISPTNSRSPISPSSRSVLHVSTSPKSRNGRNGGKKKGRLAMSPLGSRRGKFLKLLILSFMSLLFLNNSMAAAQGNLYGNHGYTMMDLQNFLIRGTPAQKSLATSLFPTLPLEQLLSASVHEHGEVRSEAVTAIAKLGTPDLRALNMLIRVSLADGYRPSRNRAVWALSVLVSQHPNLSPQVGAALKKALHDKSNANLSWNAASGLSQLGDIEATKHIASVLSMTDDGAIGLEGISSLSAHVDTQESFVFTTVYPYLTHPTFETATEAVKVIAKIAPRNTVAMKALKAMTRHSAFPQLRDFSKGLLQNAEVESRMEEYKKHKEMMIEQEKHKKKYNLKVEL